MIACNGVFALEADNMRSLCNSRPFDVGKSCPSRLEDENLDRWKQPHACGNAALKSARQANSRTYFRTFHADAALIHGSRVVPSLASSSVGEQYMALERWKWMIR
jgi:hypothetical protein